MRSTTICLLLLASMTISCTGNAQRNNLSVGEFEKSITDSKVQILDVRTAGEYESGHLKNALQADWNNPEQFKQRVKALDKNIPVYAYCLSGVRSASAAEWLRQNGYTAYNMQGGINSWNKQGKPLEQITAGTQMSMDEYLKKIPADQTVLVDFGAEWCPPCKKMEPLLAELVSTHGNKFTLVKIDGAAQKDLVKAMNVEEFPTFIVYKNGKAVWTKAGLLTKEEILAQL